MVGRRSVEACTDSSLVRGSWASDEEAGALPDDDRAFLAELDWTIEQGPAPAWKPPAHTAARPWPLDTILVEGLALEELGRPSTYADHASRALEDELVIQPSPFDLPELVPPVERAFRRLPDSIRNPATARHVARLMETVAELPGG